MKEEYKNQVQMSESNIDYDNLSASDYEELMKMV